MAVVVACTTVDSDVEKVERAEDYSTLIGGFEGGDTRIQLDEELKTVWNTGDVVSVFYRSDANQKWEYSGESGVRIAELHRVASAEATTAIDTIVVAYPYNRDYIITPSNGDLESELPDVQHYTDGSYGVGSNIMVAQCDFKQFTLLSVCGWIKIQLVGSGERVTSLRLRGNNEEQVVGPVYMDTATAEMIVVAEGDESYQEVVLDCGDGVVLGSEPTAFYITLPPQDYSRGITVDVECEGGELVTLSTTKSVDIRRNHILPMAVMNLNKGAADTYEELYYDDLDGEVATQSYGGGSYWPYIDQFSEFVNAQGPAAESISYSGYGVTVRNNANSDGSKYSDYAGSGLNNIFFGNKSYLVVENIELSAEQRNLHLEFGSQKYIKDGDSYFSTKEFSVAISDDNTLWHTLDYTFEGTEPGRWNIASADFSLDRVPERLFIKFEPSVASAYRVDDLRLSTGRGGELISFGGTGDDGDDNEDNDDDGGDSGDTNKGTRYRSGWFELPSEADVDADGRDDRNTTYYYAHHLCAGGERNAQRTATARNYSVCFSSEHHCPMWVAAPRHSMYVGDSGRSESYKKDPQIPSDIQLSSKSTGGGCNKGHMLGSAERTCSKETNKQVFYYSNIAPQYSDTFNTGGGAWNNLEDHIDDLVCRDTLYEVVGCYFERYTDKYGNTANPAKISYGGRSDVSRPTMFYYALLRTKSGNSGKSVKDCSADELQCAAFVICHEQEKGHKPESRDIISIKELEALTGFSYFDNVPNAPKNVVNASDWL